MDSPALALAVSAAPLTDVDGVFERHVSGKWATRAFEGSASGGRWGAPGAFPVIYLGRPRESIVIEAYRHLVDPVEGMSGERVRGRVCLRGHVRAFNVLDLRTDRALLSVGLTADDLVSDVDDYEACQRVGHVAHQLAFHGILAPAATGAGEVLALFPRHLAPAELPVQVGEAEVWPTLPADPRAQVTQGLRAVPDGA